MGRLLDAKVGLLFRILASLGIVNAKIKGVKHYPLPDFRKFTALNVEREFFKI
jgi:hypothetical protein